MVAKKNSNEQIKKEIALITKEIKPSIEEEAKVGENRKQLFIRIPKKISSRLNLKKGDKILFKNYYKDGKEHFEVEVKNATG